MRLKIYVQDTVNTTMVDVYKIFCNLYFQDNCLKLYKLTCL